MADTIAVLILGQFIIALPPWIIGFVSFGENLKFPKRKTYYIVVLFFTVYTCLAVALAVFFFPNVRWLHHVNNIILIVVSAALFCLTVNMRLSKIFYGIFAATSFILCLCGLHAHIEASLFPEHYAFKYIDINYIFLRSILLLFFMPLTLSFFKRQIKPHLIGNETSEWKYMWIVPTILTVIISITTGAYDTEYLASYRYLTIVLLTSISTVMIYYVIIKMLDQSKINALYKHQLDIQTEYYKTLQTHIAETRKSRHDFRHHLSIIQSYAVAGETEKLNEYLREYMESVPSGMEIAYCENYAINAILHYYAGIARDEGVEVSIRVEAPEGTGISDTDLCIVFGNCIENAIEACRKVKDGKFIKINSKLKGKMLTITVDNSFDGEIRKNGDVFLSSKREGDGIGIASVKAVADKYGESAQFEVKEHIFMATVVLQTKRE
jgi:hypothetical protein